MPESACPQYKSKIIKAGALLSDTKTLLAEWDTEADLRTNLKRARQDNWLGKSSRSRVEDVLAILRQRYLEDRDILAALVALVHTDFPSEPLDQILFFLTAQADLLLHDVVTDVLAPAASLGQMEITPGMIMDWIRIKVSEGKTEREWSRGTAERVAQGLLATLRDFGILQGVVRKRLASVYLPVSSFAFIAFLLHWKEASGDRLLHHPEWRLFFLSPQTVERLFFEAHQQHLLEYHAAGRIIRVEFPARTAEEYAHVIAQRSS